MPYQGMSLDQIAALRVRDCAEANSRLFLWATNTYLPAAFTILESWGFAYKQTLVWHKTGNPSPFVHHLAPGHSEFLLVATLGKPARTGTLLSSVIAVDANPMVLRHSQKPEAFLDLVESVSPGPYLELFARRNRLGWDTWGDEALQHVEIVA
jgi:N6-adenosine-specific RNA methylase IME4